MDNLVLAILIIGVMDFSFYKLITRCLVGMAIGATNTSMGANYFSEYQEAFTQGRKIFTADIDNDSLLFNKNDSFYTSGLRFNQTHLVHNEAGAMAFGWRIGQEIYTPSDINLPAEEVGPPEHPYAGWLYGGFFKEKFKQDGGYAKTGIDIGCLGPCAGGEWTQKNLHRLLNQPLPQGWSKQVKTELGAILYAETVPRRWTLNSVVDIAPRFKGRFGNIYTDASTGLMVRIGNLNNLPLQTGWHIFLRGDLRAVGYNATLQGGYFSNNNLHVVEPKRWVEEGEVGVAWNAGSYGARFSIVRHGNEIRGLPDSIGTQNFVRLQIVYTH